MLAPVSLDTVKRLTCWHVAEPAPGRTYHVTNTAPRMLRWILAPHAATHRIVTTQRRRASSGPSFLRLTLDPIDGIGQPRIVSIVLMRMALPERPAVPGVTG